MGDRAQIIIERADTRIHFYTHWRGSQVPAILCDALNFGKSRWSDESYLARIIFSRLSRGEETELTGFGISTAYQDSCPERDLIVNMDRKTVRYMSHEWSFEDYVKNNNYRDWEEL